MASTDSMWSTFRNQIHCLFEKGYNLPDTVQILAIHHIGSELDVWRKKVAHKHGDQWDALVLSEQETSVSAPNETKTVLSQRPSEKENVSSTPPVVDDAITPSVSTEVSPVSVRKRGRPRKTCITTETTTDNLKKETDTCNPVSVDTVKHSTPSVKTSPVVRNKRGRPRRSSIIPETETETTKLESDTSSQANDVTASPVTGGKRGRPRKYSKNTEEIAKQHDTSMSDVMTRYRRESERTHLATGNMLSKGRRRNRAVDYAQLVNRRFRNKDAATRESSHSARGKTNVDPDPVPKINKDGVIEIKPILPSEHPENELVIDDVDPIGAEKSASVDSERAPKSWSCPLCNKVYQSKSGHLLHMKKHEKQSFPCADCSFVGFSDHQLDRHIVNSHCSKDESLEVMQKWKKMRKKDKKFSCVICGKIFVSEYNLKMHTDVHNNGPIKCPHCPKTFQSKFGYDTHVKIHTKEGLSHCDLCDYVTGSKATLKKHISQVHYRETPHLCDECGRSFGTKGMLKRHAIVAHVQEEHRQWLRCPHCDHKTLTTSSLGMHIRNLHTNIQQHTCQICGVSLKYKESLNMHMKRHSSNKTYKCQECPFRAICDKDLKAHVKRKHKDTSYECEVCQKSFNDRGHLQRHRVIHTGEKKFTCRFCKYCCNVRSNLSKHLIIVHKYKEIRRNPIQKIDDECQSNASIDITDFPEIAEAMASSVPASREEFVVEVKEHVEQVEIQENLDEGAIVDLVEQAVAEAVGDVKRESEGFCLEMKDIDLGAVHGEATMIIQRPAPTKLEHRTIRRLAPRAITPSSARNMICAHPQEQIIVQHVPNNVTVANSIQTGHATNCVTVSDPAQFGHVIYPETIQNYHVTDHVSLPDTVHIGAVTEDVASHEIVQETVQIDHLTTVDDMGNEVKQVFVTSEDGLHLFTDDNSVVLMTIDS